MEILTDDKEEKLDYKKMYEEMKKERDEALEKYKKYSCRQTDQSLKYYEKNKEHCKERMREYNKTYKANHSVTPTDPEKIKEYNKRAYEKRKQKKLEELNEKLL